MQRINRWAQFDYWLFGAVVTLTVFGVAMIRSAIAGTPGLAGLDQKQVTWGLAGLVVMMTVALIDYRYLKSMTVLMYVVGFVALLGIVIAGQTSFGAQRWFQTALFSIQPSELVKILMIMILAHYFSATKDQPRDLKWIVMGLALAGGMAVLIYLQPNLSTTIVVMVLWFSMLWVSGLPPKFLLYFGAGGLVGGLALFPFIEPYQQQRVLDFVFVNENATYGNTFNVQQALISIGSGGWFGMGYGHGTQVQLHFLKVRHTDFIFSAMAEEFGFVGTVLVISLILFVVLRCLRVARTADDPYGALLAYGVGILILFQTIVNVGVNLKVIPVTGLTLPFISYGGSSLLSLVLGIGLVESVAAHRTT